MAKVCDRCSRKEDARVRVVATVEYLEGDLELSKILDADLCTNCHTQLGRDLVAFLNPPRARE